MDAENHKVAKKLSKTHVQSNFGNVCPYFNKTQGLDNRVKCDY